ESGLDVRIVDEVGERARDLDVLFVAVETQTLVALRAVLRTERIGIEAEVGAHTPGARLPSKPYGMRFRATRGTIAGRARTGKSTRAAGILGPDRLTGSRCLPKSGRPPGANQGERRRRMQERGMAGWTVSQ